MSLKSLRRPLLFALGLVPFVLLIARYAGQSGQQEELVFPEVQESGAQDSRRSPDLLAPVSARESRTESPVIDGAGGLESTDYEELKPVELRDGELWVGGDRLSSVHVESWPRESLYRLIQDIQSIQIQSMVGFVESHPTEHLFISDEDYTARGLWHEDTVFHTTLRTVVDSAGEEVEEYGRIAVPRDLHPDAYVLRAAIVRAYKAPEYARFLMEEGADYETKVFAAYPGATSDVTSDLTHWTYFDADGKIIGSMSFPRNGNN